MSIKVRRSVLFVPINNPRFLERAWTRNADALILDLEDSVPPAQKEYARSLVREAIPLVSRGGAEVFVRINKEFMEADLHASIWPGVSRIVLPKTEWGEEVRRADELITHLEKKRGIPVGTVEITPLIESALGVSNVYETASASPRLRFMGGGTGYDMSQDLGIEMFVGFDQLLYPRSECSLAMRALGKTSTSGPYVPEPQGRVNNPEWALQYARACFLAGIREATGLHPAVVEPFNRGLTPTPEEVAWARRVLEAYQELEEREESVGELEGRVIDRYEARRARELILWAEACAAQDARKERAMKRAQGGEP